MRVRGAADLLLLVIILLLRLSQAERTNDKRNQDSEVRPRRHDSEERTSSGRRWTTSVNSPYQKIVSSYEQGDSEPREAASEHAETSVPGDADQAKAKSHKRKQTRTNAPSHDQIPSETSSDSQKAVVGSNAPNTTDPEVPEVQRSQKPSASSSRRRASSHQREQTTEALADVTTSNPKKRRRPATPASTTTTLAPQTMSDSLYQYFRPLDQDVPQDDIIPFLDFGRKLSPVIPTPSGANSIENRSRITKLRPRGHHEERESNSSDEEILQEDMDVTVVKKAIERNSVPRGKLRVREQGISDYYRKRVPTQVRTTENLISTSDSSTASSVPSSKNIGVLKKLNRHQIHHVQPLKAQEHVSEKISPEVELVHDPKNVEVVQDKRRQTTPRTIQRSAALKLETHHSPLTAESTLVKTVIKEFPLGESPDGEAKNITKITTRPNVTISEGRKRLSSSAELEEEKPPATKANQSISNNEEEHNPKILSTAVVTSVSVQESLKESQQHSVTAPPKEETNNSEPANSTTTLSPPVELTKNTTYARPSIKSYISIKNSTNTILPNSTEPATNTNISSEPKTTTAKNETPLRSREIYRPKGIPPGSFIPHLPRQIPFSPSLVSPSPKTVSSLESTTKPTATFRSFVKPSALIPTSSPTVTTNQEESTVSTTNTPARAIIRNNATTKRPEMISSNPSSSTVTVPRELSKYDKAKDGVIQPNISQHVPIVPSVMSGVSSSKENANSNRTTPSTDDVEDRPRLRNQQPSNHKNDPSPYDDQARGVEEQTFTESDFVPQTNEEPTDNLTFVPVYSSDVDSDDLFPIYFTTVTPPVVDTRPETEAAVVEEQRNATTPRPGAEWLNVGAGDKEVEVVYPEPLGAAAYVLAALGVVPILVGALIGARFIMVHNKKKVLDESEYSSEYNRSPLGVSSVTPLPTKLPRIPTHVSWSETEKSTPTISPVTSATSSSASGGSVGVRWEFSREKLRLQTVLGQGNFGQVWKAEADDISGHEGLTRLVAVKTVKETANLREREDLLRELGIMQELGSHPNVVTLLGCCTEKEPIYLIMEYVMYGKLLSFLRDHRTRAHYYNFSDATDALTSRDLTVFAYCVARGMDYLSNKSIIHRDLAARNVLVDHNKLCKIADFGMSRNVRDTGQIYEQRQSKGALPIRWMAPESLHFSLFTHKTDVWSFGILMWEIVTLGSTPYARMGAREVMRRVRDGYRLDRPSHCRPELFRVIAQCWHSEPSKRPSFAELKAELAQLLSDSELNGSYVDLDSFADEMRRDTLHRHH